VWSDLFSDMGVWGWVVVGDDCNGNFEKESLGVVTTDAFTRVGLFCASLTINLGTYDKNEYGIPGTASNRLWFWLWDVEWGKTW
jgi:hypothetical protein